MTQRKRRRVIETRTVLYRSLPLRALISHTALLFWGTVSSLLIQLYNTVACTCNARVCYTLRDSWASDTHTIVPKIQRRVKVQFLLTISRLSARGFSAWTWHFLHLPPPIFFLLAKTFCVIILLDGGQPVLTLPLTSSPSSGLQVKDFVMLQQAAELEELQLQPECSGVALASRHKITISMCCVCNKLHFFFSL